MKGQYFTKEANKLFVDVILPILKDGLNKLQSSISLTDRPTEIKLNGKNIFCWRISFDRLTAGFKSTKGLLEIYFILTSVNFNETVLVEPPCSISIAFLPLEEGDMSSGVK